MDYKSLFLFSLFLLVWWLNTIGYLTVMYKRIKNNCFFEKYDARNDKIEGNHRVIFAIIMCILLFLFLYNPNIVLIVLVFLIVITILCIYLFYCIHRIKKHLMQNESIDCFEKNISILLISITILILAFDALLLEKIIF